MRQCFLMAVVVVHLLAGTALATTHHVDVGGGGDYENIWAAVDAASDGDTILVAPGIYLGVQNRNINFGGRNIVLVSEAGTAATTINCDGAARAFVIESGEDSTCVVRGFTVTNAYSYPNGGAISIANSSPRIEQCVFTDCVCDIGGGVLYAYMSSSAIRDCVFRSNHAANTGGAVATYNASIRLSRCVFDENTVGGVGGALYLNSGTETVHRCTFSENEPHTIYSYFSEDLVITNSVLANCTNGNPLIVNSGYSVTTTHCVVFGNAATDSLQGTFHHNIFYDPLFCNAPADDYTHCADSKCLPANNDWDELIGALGKGCDACDTPVERSSWGAVKAMFR